MQLVQCYLGRSSPTIRQETERKDIQIGKEEIKKI